jgi:hypothetical protein
VGALSIFCCAGEETMVNHQKQQENPEKGIEDPELFTCVIPVS